MNKNYHNPEESSVVAKPFGNLQVKKYFGKNVELQFIAELAKEAGKKYIGTASYVVKENAWYFYPFSCKNRNEAFRIPEPADGIDEVFELNFQRVSE